MTKAKPTQAAPDSLMECAQLVINTFKEPGELLFFIADAIDGVNTFEGNKRGSVGVLTNMLSGVLYPWVKGDTGSLVTMREAFKRMYDNAGAESFQEEITELVLGISRQMEGANDQDRYLSGIKFLHKIGVLFYRYEAASNSKTL